MAIRYDLQTTSTGDLDIAAKNFGVQPSDLIHQQNMFSSFPGEWKQFPNNGIGLARYLKASNPKTINVLKNKARQQLQADGYDVGNMKVSFGPTGILQIQTAASR